MRKRARENTRKTELINAAIQTIARSGTIDVTVAEIAREAGMSPALAHHYFGSKDMMFLSAMRENDSAHTTVDTYETAPLGYISVL